MKKILTILTLIFISTFALAQKTRVTTPTSDTSKPQTLKVPAPNTVAKRLPDLRLSALNFTLVSSKVEDGVTSYTFQINYTVKNEGTASVAANTVLLQGTVGRTTNFPSGGGCGSMINTFNGDMIDPGGSKSGWFRCTVKFDRNNPPMYTLSVDASSVIKESNEENNTAQATIIF